MSADRDAVLDGSNPEWERPGTHHYGDPDAEALAVDREDVIAALNHLGVIEVRGRDSASLLQGQLTADLDLLGPRRTVLSAWCTPKGRVLTTLRVLECKPVVLLLLPREHVASTVARMRMYVLRADVQLEDVSHRVLALGAAGRRTGQRLAEALGEVPNDVDRAVCCDDCIAVRLQGSEPRFVVLASKERLRTVWQQLTGVARPVGSNAWRLSDIRAGVPELSGSLAEAFLPQMLNLQALGAVSFTKGCYTGQEIVARTQHLGRLKRRLYLAQAPPGEAPVPGDTVYRTDRGDGKGVGTVVSAAANAAGRWELLAVVEIDAAEQGTIGLGGDGAGRALELRALPYSLDGG